MLKVTDHRKGVATASAPSAASRGASPASVGQCSVGRYRTRENQGEIGECVRESALVCLVGLAAADWGEAGRTRGCRMRPGR